jgi:pyridoxamine 5'-phosphate oxidase
MNWFHRLSWAVHLARYSSRGFGERDASADPVEQFARWYEDPAVKGGMFEPTAVALATAGRDGSPRCRMVLLKGYDARGFVFYTNYRSDKGAELSRRPRAALLFYWPELGRQVRIEGRTSRVSAGESDAYFATRPRGSQIGAWASEQSAPVASREALESRVREFEARFAGGPVPRPPHWGGYRLTPELLEFWQGRPSRLHDRLRYRRQGRAWKMERLSP